MKTIKVTELVEKEVLLPRYFKSKSNSAHYFAIISEDNCIHVANWVLDPEMDSCRPLIEVVGNHILDIYTKKGWVELTEDEFKKIYSEVSFRIEELSN